MINTQWHTFWHSTNICTNLKTRQDHVYTTMRVNEDPRYGSAAVSYCLIPCLRMYQAMIANTPRFGPQLAGFCVTSALLNQNTGVTKILTGDYGDTPATALLCLQACSCFTGGIATGCEMIWGRTNRGCYVHTQDVGGGGQGADLHACYVVT